MNDMKSNREERDPRLGQLLKNLEAPPSRSSFWREIESAIVAGQPDSGPSEVRQSIGERLRARWKSDLVLAASALAVVAAILVGLSRLQGGAGGDGSCANFVYWNGARYRGESIKAGSSMRILGPLQGTGRLPSCSDTGGTQTNAVLRRVRVYRIAGINPQHAIALRSEPSTEFIRDRPSAQS